MLQAHSPLWNYLWVAPNALLLVLSFLLFRRGLHRHYPVFFVASIVSAFEQLIVYAADITPSVGPETWWRIFWAGLLVEGLLKVPLIGAVFGDILADFPSLAKLGKFLLSGVGVAFVLAAAVLAAFVPPTDSPYGLISGAHVLEQTIYLIESGLLLFIFLFCGYCRLRPKHPTFGIALGLVISACVHLATWAIAANAGLPASKRVLLDFVNMAAYHVCVLIWFYYLLVPHQVTTNSAPPPPDHNLELWNRELERLLQ